MTSEAEDKNLPEKPELPPTFTRINSRGLIEVLDLHTGRILCVQSTPLDLLQAKSERLTKIMTPQGPVWIEKGINFDIVNHLVLVPYSKHLGDLICQYIVEGDPLKVAVKKINLQYSDVMRWQRENADFKAALDQARKDRTEAHHDEILQIAKEAPLKTQIEVLQWSAEKNNPEKFGNKTKVVGDPHAPVVFQINTGIRRELPPGEGETGAPETTPGVQPEREAQKVESDIPELPE